MQKADPPAFGQRSNLIEWEKENCLSKPLVAKKLGLSGKQYMLLKQGYRRISLSVVKNFMKQFNKDIDEACELLKYDNEVL